MINTDLLRSDPKIYHKKVLGDKDTKKLPGMSTEAQLIFVIILSDDFLCGV